MGVGLLDLSFRIQRQFSVEIRGEPMRRLAAQAQRVPFDMTAGELHELICDLCNTGGIPIPDDSWPRLQRILGEMELYNPDDIQKGTWLIQDLGME